MTVLKRRFSALERSFTPLSLLLARGYDVESADGLHLLVQLGDGQGLLRKDGDERILHVRTDTGEAPMRSILPSTIAFITGVCTRAPSLGPLGEKTGIVQP